MFESIVIGLVVLASISLFVRSRKQKEKSKDKREQFDGESYIDPKEKALEDYIENSMKSKE